MKGFACKQKRRLDMFSWSTDWNTRAKTLSEQGLYDSANEHDACGVGLIASIDGKPRRDVVEAGINALKAVFHRGAVDADGKTGDGAGINIQIPKEFFTHHILQMGKKIRSPHLAVGMVFLPKKNMRAQEECRGIIEAEVLKFGYSIYGWRQVPINAKVIGEIANDSRPEIEQILISGREDIAEEQFELDLFIIRRRIEKAVLAKGVPDFYICSLSNRSIIYKGLFKAEQLTEFYPDLLSEQFVSNYAIFHQRFSTNTAPAWHLAQPFRILAHNGEINTLKGNVNFMRSHEATMQCSELSGFENDIQPIIPDNTSDTGALDSVMEVLIRGGRSVPLSKLILIPPAWGGASDMPQAHRDLFSFCNAISEPWDGPAAIAATDGKWIIAGMDRNGLRPMRYAITEDNLLLLGSESGMVPVSDSKVRKKGRLGPGEIIGINLEQGAFYSDRELKDLLAAQHPFHEWVKSIVVFDSLVKEPAAAKSKLSEGEIRQLQHAIGQTLEDVEQIIHPMAEMAKEGVGSMGDDTPLQVIAKKYRGFHHFFRQNFSQVTNPPIDSLRERRVMSLNTRFGNDGNFLAFDESQCNTVLLSSPVLLSHELRALTKHYKDKITVIDTLFDLRDSKNALRKGLDRIIKQAEDAVHAGKPYLILTDEKRDANHAAIPSILAVGAIQTHLVRKKLRKRASLIVRTAECMDVHHFAVLIGVGATVVNAWLAEEVILERHQKGLLGKLSGQQAISNFKEAASQGILKIMSKMGISVVSSYRGGCNFEAIGLSRALVSEFFLGLPSRISGLGLEGIENRILAMHHKAFGHAEEPLPIGGFYKFRAREELHAYQGPMIHTLQTAVEKGSYQLYKKYSDMVRSEPPVNLRDLLDFNTDRAAIDVDQVESITEIRKRFVAPAMSLGALSPEAHEILAIAMNRMGAASNSGEGGEGAERYQPRPNGDNPNSTIKQIASARFGVTAEYLNSASELQIKVAQGAKPGEGGQLPAFKVTLEIARLRHATPGVSLISPPPHHDIYSIEDLAQLIYDLKQINPSALVSVKLVAQSGIGTIASGVAKAMADKIVIAGHTGGTGASPYSSIKHAGIPWEMGLSEANQVLTLNRMRHRVKLQTDGGLKTGRDIVMAALLGAEEYALGTASLVAMGCILVRQCHSNTCPVGITTQNPELRKKFEGTVEKVVNLFSFIAEEVREILAQLGYRSLNEIIGRADLIKQVGYGSDDLVDLDLNPLLALADAGLNARYCTLERRNEVPDTLDAQMIKDAHAALEHGEKIQLAYNIKNTQRAIGTRLSSTIIHRFDTSKLQPDHITIRLRGSAGQSLGAFAVRGLKIEVLGDANDYVGKGLSGATITLRTRPSSKLIPHENVIIGNTVLYGATSGKLFAAGQAGERFAVRNSGAITVVEGCGSNGCEYMTGGTAVLLGRVGDNFAAGMTGGMAFVYDTTNHLDHAINPETVIYQRVETQHWQSQLKTLITEHAKETGSPLAENILLNWHLELPKFWQICPKEMVSRLEFPLSDTQGNKKTA
jgi:glutamate synthase (NADPH/NADH) large chain